MKRNEMIDSAHHSVSRLARGFQQLMREQLSCGPVTVQQCYTLAALVDGPRNMKLLAADVGLHQSTLTRVVEKLERQGLVARCRSGSDQRTVEVELTRTGRQTHRVLDEGARRIVGTLLDSVSRDERKAAVKGLEILAGVLDPHGAAFGDLLVECCRTDAATAKESGIRSKR
jgi:DNA-binding MarR family transcriptional regulator